MTRKPSITIIGAGSLASGLAPALKESGYRISEIVTRNASNSRSRGRRLAAQVGGRVVTLQSARFDADLLWFCVPDGQIRPVSEAVAALNLEKVKVAFHSSGALLSRELGPLRKMGIAIASVHPLMTFVSGPHPDLDGVPFALEGGARALKMARTIVSDLRGEAFTLAASRKSAYHAWATLTSPLLVAFLAVLEETGRLAGLEKQAARRKSLPIIRQTLTNYAHLGPAQSFSGPIIRGDVATVAHHLEVLKKSPLAKEVYVALAHSALRNLPVKNRRKLGRLLEGVGRT